MRKIYDRILEIRGNTCTVRAKDVALGETAQIYLGNKTRKHGMVIRIQDDLVTLQVFESTGGLSTSDRVLFLKHTKRTFIGEHLLSRRFNAQGVPIDGGTHLEGVEVDLSNQTFNPVRRTIPSQFVRTNIPMIDVYNTLVRSQKLPIFSTSGEPYNELIMRIANQTDSDIILIGGMGLRYDDYLQFVDNAESSGSISKTAMFIHLATDPAVECLLIPDMVLTAAEQFAIQGKNVLVMLTDMTAYADAHKEIQIGQDMIPSNRGYPGDLYSQLAFRYEKAVDILDSGSITLLAVTTMPGGDITHPIPDNTGYITEGQYFLQNGVIDPFGSLSRLKQLVIGKSTREDHSIIANITIRLYAEALKGRERESMGFKLSSWDEKLLGYATLFEEVMMDLEKNIPLEEALNEGWKILARCFDRQEVGIPEKMLDQYWPLNPSQH